MPTFMVFRGGEPVLKLVGARPKRRFVDELGGAVDDCGIARISPRASGTCGPAGRRARRASAAARQRRSARRARLDQQPATRSTGAPRPAPTRATTPARALTPSPAPTRNRTVGRVADLEQRHGAEARGLARLHRPSRAARCPARPARTARPLSSPSRDATARERVAGLDDQPQRLLGERRHRQAAGISGEREHGEVDGAAAHELERLGGRRLPQRDPHARVLAVEGGEHLGQADGVGGRGRHPDGAAHDAGVLVHRRPRARRPRRGSSRRGRAGPRRRASARRRGSCAAAAPPRARPRAAAPAARARAG